MICYNFPERGAFEYDKFVISILEYYNESVRIRQALDKQKNEGMKDIIEDINARFLQVTEQSKSAMCLAIEEKII